MPSRRLTLAAVASWVLLAAVVVAWLVAGSVHAGRTHLAIPGVARISLYAWGADARLVLFNDAHGPYMGGTLAVVGPDGTGGPAVTGFGDVVGLYYRRIVFPDGQVIWTLAISLLYPLLLCLVLPAAWYARRVWALGRGTARQTADV